MYKPVKLILPETICRICKINVGLCHTDGLCQSRPYRVQSARRRAGAAGFEPANIRVKAACVRTDFTIPQYIYVRHFVCAARNKRNPARNLFCFIGKGTAYLLKDSVVVVPQQEGAGADSVFRIREKFICCG